MPSLEKATAVARTSRLLLALRMIRVQRIYISPVKSLGLASLDRAFLDKPGIPGDRAFFIVDAEGKLFTQRVFGPLVQVQTGYEHKSGRMELTFPEANAVSGVPRRGLASKHVREGA